MGSLYRTRRRGWPEAGIPSASGALAEVASQDETWAELEELLGLLAERTTDAAEKTYSSIERARLRLDSLDDAPGALELLDSLVGGERPDSAVSLSSERGTSQG